MTWLWLCLPSIYLIGAELAPDPFLVPSVVLPQCWCLHLMGFWRVWDCKAKGKTSGGSGWCSQVDLLLDWWLFQSEFLSITSGSSGDSLIHVCSFFLSTFFELVIYSNFWRWKRKKSAEDRKDRVTSASGCSCPFPGMVPRTGTFLPLALPFALWHPGNWWQFGTKPLTGWRGVDNQDFHIFL